VCVLLGLDVDLGVLSLDQGRDDDEEGEHDPEGHDGEDRGGVHRLAPLLCLCCLVVIVGG